MIFTTDKYISDRIYGVGFLPTFHGQTPFGKDLWYSLISPNEVLENIEFDFSLSNLFEQRFFRFWPKDAISHYETSPLEVLKRKIIMLNMTIEGDRALLRSVYNVHYVISINETSLHNSNEWTLIRSLHQSELEPIFSTQNLVVWKIK